MASTRKTTDGCRFGDSCFDTKCKNGHPEQCRHDPRCTNSNCKFWHPIANAPNSSRTERPTRREERPTHREERPTYRDERPVQRKHQIERSQKEHQTESIRGTQNVFAEKLIEKYEAEIEELKKKLKIQEKEISELKDENAKLKDENAKLKPSGMQQPVKRGLFS